MKLSIQTGGILEFYSYDKAYALIADTGFEAIDWNIDQACPSGNLRNLTYEGTCIFEKPLDEVKAYYEEELNAIRKHDLTITQAHAPFPAYVPGHPEVLEYSIKIYKRCIEFCDYAGCKNLIVHGISLPYSDVNNTPEDIDALNMRLYESLIPTLLQHNVTVCLENLFTSDNGLIVEGTCADAHEAVRYIDTLNEKAGREVFGFCLDFGHLQILGKNPRTYIPILGKRIKALHIHDNDGRTDLHQAPLAGKLHWDVYCDCLRQIGYDGDLSFETFAQTAKAFNTYPELLPVWLEMIAKTGKIFRKHIQG